jgi:uncharacterized membrane protein YfcA
MSKSLLCRIEKNRAELLNFVLIGLISGFITGIIGFQGLNYTVGGNIFYLWLISSTIGIIISLAIHFRCKNRNISLPLMKMLFVLLGTITGLIITIFIPDFIA